MLIEKVCLPRYLFRYVTNTLCYLRNVLGVDAVDGVAHVLPRRHDEREGEQAHHREGVVQPEYRAVDVDVADLDQVLEAAEDVQHDWTSVRCGSDSVAL